MTNDIRGMDKFKSNMTKELKSIFKLFESPDAEVRVLGLNLFCDSKEVKELTSKSFYTYIQHYRKCFTEVNEQFMGLPDHLIHRCLDYFINQISIHKEFGLPVFCVGYAYKEPKFIYKGIRLY